MKWETDLATGYSGDWQGERVVRRSWRATLLLEGREVFRIWVEMLDGRFCARSGYLGVRAGWLTDIMTDWQFADTPEEAIQSALAISDDVVEGLQLRSNMLLSMRQPVAFIAIPVLTDLYGRLCTEAQQLRIVQMHIRGFSDFPAAASFEA